MKNKVKDGRILVESLDFIDFKFFIGEQYEWVVFRESVTAKNVPGMEDTPVLATLLTTTQDGIRNINRILSELIAYNFEKEEHSCDWETIAKYRKGILVGLTLDWNGIDRLVSYDEVGRRELLDSWLGEADFVVISPKSAISGAYSGDTDLELLMIAAKEVVMTLGAMGKTVIVKLGTNEITEELTADFAWLGGPLSDQVLKRNPYDVVAKLEPADEPRPALPAIYLPGVENAEDLIEDRCYKNAYALYGGTIPQDVKECLEKELRWLRRTDQASRFLLAAKLAKRCREQKIPFAITGKAANYLMAKLLGITDLRIVPEYVRENPLKGKDGKPMKFPMFMAPMLFKLGDCGNTDPFDMLVPDEDAREEVLGFLDEIYGEDKVFYIGEKRKSNTPREGRYMILPRNREIYDYSPAVNVVRIKDGEESDFDRNCHVRKLAVNAIWPGEVAEIRIDLDPVLARLQELEKAAGETAPSMSVEDIDLTYIFRDGIYQELPILSEYPESFAQNVFRCNFMDLVKILGIRHFKKGTAQQLFSLKQREFDNIPLHMEEVFRMLLEHGLDSDAAADVAFVVSTKDVNPFPTEDDFKEMMEHGISSETVKWLKGRRTLVEEGEDAELAYHLLQIVWFRKNRPDIFFS